MDLRVISYNTSVFSAMGAPFFGPSIPAFPSESRLLARASEPKEFFNNALLHLSKVANVGPHKDNDFPHNAKPMEDYTKFESMPSADIIGIKEYHNNIGDFIEYLGDAYNYEPFETPLTNNAKILTIWKKTLGEKEGKYESDFGLTPPESGYTPAPADKGRPITLIKLSSGLCILNFHGINKGKYNPDGTINNTVVQGPGPMIQSALEYHLMLAQEKVGPIDLTKLVITCDSNDREHYLGRGFQLGIGVRAERNGKYIGPLESKITTFSDGNNGKKTITCCYNFDSCGIIKPLAPAPAPVKFKSNRSAKERQEYAANTGTEGRPILGTEDEYVYTGDYVLAREFVEPLQVAKSPVLSDGVSAASDHMLVYAKVRIDGLTSKGGYRKSRKGRKGKSRKTRSRRH